MTSGQEREDSGKKAEATIASIPAKYSGVDVDASGGFRLPRCIRGAGTRPWGERRLFVLPGTLEPGFQPGDLVACPVDRLLALRRPRGGAADAVRKFLARLVELGLQSNFADTRRDREVGSSDGADHAARLDADVDDAADRRACDRLILEARALALGGFELCPLRFQFLAVQDEGLVKRTQRLRPADLTFRTSADRTGQSVTPSPRALQPLASPWRLVAPRPDCLQRRNTVRGAAKD